MIVKNDLLPADKRAPPGGSKELTVIGVIVDDNGAALDIVAAANEACRIPFVGNLVKE